ncbi:MAG TPA: M20 family metallo-hydrolase [Saprospiraceae bacterium]|nr:M20 family metallo-hydrolase [Saprospiraceae bacterium]HPI09359.1 M20 family metallo-hydrolase [Saprospiraceae bacterium]
MNPDTAENHKNLAAEAVALLRRLIATPSFSREEAGTAVLLESFFQEKGIPAQRLQNNVWARNRYFDASKPTVLLNSHHDTVKPNAGYTRDPFAADIVDGKLYGLGSNDAGGPLVSLLAAFLYFYERKDLSFNLLYAATAEEEISGKNGVELLLPELGRIDCAIVGEPTQMHMAVAEKGLMVLDCTTHGQSGHAAREEGDNALYKALADIDWFRHYRFPNVSELLGPVKMSVTIIQAGTQHNVVPDTCRFTVDVRVNELYTLEEVLETVRANVQAEVVPRSLRIRSTGIAPEHPLVRAGVALGRSSYGSPTTSDKALMPFPALKMGPGDSARSHTADEFIFLEEIENGIEGYVGLLGNFDLMMMKVGL